MTLEKAMDICFLPNWREEIKKDTEIAIELRLRQMNIKKVLSICQQEIDEAIEKCAKIAESYEPDEKQSYITYASKDIRKLKSTSPKERL